MAGLSQGINQNTATAHSAQTPFTVIGVEAAKVPAGGWVSIVQLSSQQVVNQPHRTMVPTHSTPGKPQVSEKSDAKDPMPPALPTGNTQRKQRQKQGNTTSVSGNSGVSIHENVLELDKGNDCTAV